MLFLLCSVITITALNRTGKHFLAVIKFYFPTIDIASHEGACTWTLTETFYEYTTITTIIITIARIKFKSTRKCGVYLTGVIKVFRTVDYSLN